METKDENKIVPSFDELVFENRNMEYGAYQIRKRYSAALLWSILVSVFFISASVITPFVILKGRPIVVEPPKDSSTVIFVGTNLPIDNPEPKQPNPEPVKVKAPIYVAPVVVETLAEEDANKFGTNEDYLETVKNDSVIEEVQVARVEIDPTLDDNKVKEIIEISEKPSFGIEGDNEFRRWISKNLVYPRDPLENGVQGRVYVQFVVEKDGSLTNIIAARSIDPALSKEAVRVVSLSPKWSPGKQQGVPVRVRYSFPITFAIK